jgi:GT2 family glycosyltransferase
VPPAPAVDIGADAIKYALDSVDDHAFPSSGLVPIVGWACAEAGIDRIDIVLDGRFVTRIGTGNERKDVASAFPGIPDAGRSGFSGSLDLSGEAHGTHDLRLAIHDRAGHSVHVDRTIRLVAPDTLYHEYYLRGLPARDEEQRLVPPGASPVHFDVWITFDGADAGRLSETLRSVTDQAYPDWRLYLRPSEDVVVDCPGSDGRITIAPADGLHEHLRPHPPGSVPRFLVFLTIGDVLAPGALSRAAAYLHDHPQTTLLYSDHDRVKAGGLHHAPSFKPDWSPDYSLARNYVGDVFFVRQDAETLRLCRELLASSAPAWRYDLLLHLGLGDVQRTIAHVPEVLWSRRDTAAESHPDETRAVRDALQRRGSTAEVAETGVSGVRHISWPHPASRPTVTIIIPTTGNLTVLRPCIESLLAKTRYPAYQLLMIDNSRGRHPDGIAFLRDHGLQVLERNEPFNWAKLNNDAARASTGDVLLFLNDDIEVVDETWLDELVALVCRDEVGTVGALLQYPDGHIQHGGIFLVDHGGGARHHLAGLHPDAPVYENLHMVTREVSASTGACLAIRRELFERLGGFDADLAIVGNDVDLCLRVEQAGYRNVWTPRCRLIHHESVSRAEIRISDDERKMWRRWAKAFRAGDPYYSQHLSQVLTDCSLNLDRLRRTPEAAGADDMSAVGANLIGYIKAEMGIGEAMRGLAAACDAAAVPIDIVNYERGNPARMGDERWSHRTTDRPRQAINILYVNADVTPHARQSLPDHMFDGRYTVGYWAWELPEFPDDWLESFRYVNEVWVPSRFVQDAVAAKSPVPVLRIPHAVERTKLPALNRRYFGLPERVFLFLMMYDVNSVQERKNPRGAIEAFKRAFAGADDTVGLVVKINNGTARELAEIRAQIEDYPNIVTLTQTLSRYEVDSLILACDAFVSLHRSEGFGLVIAEAMALGRPVVATNWSGNTDFMNESNAACVDFRLVPLERDHGPYKKGQLWADPDVAHAAWWMQSLRRDGDRRARLTATAVETIERQHSAARVGALVRTRLDYIRRGLA